MQYLAKRWGLSFEQSQQPQPAPRHRTRLAAA
jgi:hypothetical protein